MSNPLKQLANGQQVPDIKRAPRTSGKIGNLYYDYIEDTSLQKKGIKSIHLAEDLQDRKLITVTDDGFYEWNSTPLSKQEILDFYFRDPKVKAASQAE